MMQYMKAKEDLALIPGGFEEATITWCVGANANTCSVL
jgi:hypothetical protein